MSDKKYVTYEEFGAKGDGVTDDFAALFAAHKYANENGLDVKARDDAHYYIHSPLIDGEVEVIKIKTNVNWGKARFTIDDRDVSVYKEAETYKWYSKPIFHIVADYEPMRIDDEATLKAVLDAGLNKSTVKIPLKFDYPVMIVPHNSTHNVYRRCGYGAWKGDDMHEVILLDKDGNVSEETPVMFDYGALDYITVYRVDERPLVIEGGVFTTRSTNVNTLYINDKGEKTNVGGYLMRGLKIERSNTLVKNVQHYITDEPTMNQQVDENGEVVFIAACYRGFYLSVNANRITLKDCVMTGRRCYKRPTGGTGGTYDLSGNGVNKIVFDGCRQSNFWVTVDENNVIHSADENTEGAVTSMSFHNVNGNVLKMHWGVGGTNFCKNMEYHNSTLSRFDAHAGLYNGKIINSTVNYMAITGNGKFIVENTRWFASGENYGSNALIHLRADYGSTWEGDVTVKNVKAYVYTEGPTYTFYHNYNNWYYGYKAHFPNIAIENLEYYDQKTREPLPQDYEIRIAAPSILKEPALHLAETVNTPPRFPAVDTTGDGFVDGTKIPLAECAIKKGATDESQRVNLNPIEPPEYISIKGNANAYKYVAPDTSKQGVSGGGFFGKTRFVTDNNEYIGTDHLSDTEFFAFVEPETLA